MKTKTYLALTIGPINKTLERCKKTRELWAGSYIFSYFMHVLISKLWHEAGLPIQFLQPHVDDEVIGSTFEIGVFHDRFIAKSELSLVEVEKVLNDKFSEAVDELVDIIPLATNAISREEIRIALLEYLQYHYVLASEDDLTVIDSRNTLSAINRILDSMELQYGFGLNNDSKIFADPNNSRNRIDPIAQLQFYPQSLKKMVINKRSQEGKSSSLVFRSVPEIASANLMKQRIQNHIIAEALLAIGDNDEADVYDAFYKVLSDNEYPGFKPYHKYYAVISADIDDMGVHIEREYRKNADSITDISKSIYDYIAKGTSLHELFEQFGGMLIYAGGDDLLAFAPVFGEDGRSVFEIVEEISKKLKSKLSEEISISFGISIRYYKSPMTGSIRQANNMLRKAKNNNNETDNINTDNGSVALSLSKHSGQSYEAVFLLGDDKYQSYKELFIGAIDGGIALPHAVHLSMVRFGKLFASLYSGTNVEYIDNRVDSVFENLILDDSHRASSRHALNRLKHHIKILRPKNDDEYKTFIAQLAIIKFLRGDK